MSPDVRARDPLRSLAAFSGDGAKGLCHLAEPKPASASHDRASVYRACYWACRRRRISVGCLSAHSAYFARMSVNIAIPDDLAEQIDHVATDRTAFVAEAVRRLLRDTSIPTLEEEVARINQFADELNREAEDVLEYQVLS